jgi:DNA-binding XRE family transcriptional regulator
MSKPKPIPNNKLKHARLKLLLTIEEAAQSVEASITSYGRWERGIQKPQLVTLRKLCKLFNATPKELGFENFPD